MADDFDRIGPVPLLPGSTTLVDYGSLWRRRIRARPVDLRCDQLDFIAAYFSDGTTRFDDSFWSSWFAVGSAATFSRMRNAIFLHEMVHLLDNQMRGDADEAATYVRRREERFVELGGTEFRGAYAQARAMGFDRCTADAFGRQYMRRVDREGEGFFWSNTALLGWLLRELLRCPEFYVGALGAIALALLVATLVALVLAFTLGGATASVLGPIISLLGTEMVVYVMLVMGVRFA